VAVGLYRTADPWDRADASSASAFVAAERSADEPVVFNHWEYEYYFRGVAGAAYWQGGPLPPAERLWLIVTAADPAAREQLLGAVAREWRLLGRREFDRTSVVRLGPRGDGVR